VEYSRWAWPSIEHGDSILKACIKRKCNNMIERGVDASCSEGESDYENDAGNDVTTSDAAKEHKTPGKVTKALTEKLKGQAGIKDCFISLTKLNVDSNVLLKHMGYKWVGESIGTVKDKVYYNQVTIICNVSAYLNAVNYVLSERRN